jgi:hypothetical protein
MRGSPWIGLSGAIVTTFTPASVSASDGISKNSPCVRPTEIRGGSAAGSTPAAESVGDGLDRRGGSELGDGGRVEEPHRSTNPGTSGSYGSIENTCSPVR